MKSAVLNAHVLESSFREETRAEGWVDTGRVRFSHSNVKGASGIRALAGVKIDYEVCRSNAESPAQCRTS